MISGKKIGDPCPKCQASLLRRPKGSLFRASFGDVAYCPCCNSAWEIEGEEAPAAFLPLSARPAGA